MIYFSHNSEATTIAMATAIQAGVVAVGGLSMVSDRMSATILSSASTQDFQAHLPASGSLSSVLGLLPLRGK